MSKTSQSAAAADIITFSKGYQPMAVYFLAVPALIILLIGLNVATMRLHPAMIAILSVVGGTCVVWIMTALDEIGDLTIELSPEELRLRGLAGGTSYSWSFIEDIKIVNPGATLSDSGRNEDTRVGIGLFLRKAANQSRPESDGAPDVVVLSGSRDQVELVMSIAERMKSFQRRGRAGAQGRKGGGFNTSRKGFRKSPAQGEIRKAS